MKNEEPWQTNRQKKRTPKQGKYWCNHCDAQLVTNGPKCPNCHHRNTKTKTNKK